VHAPAKDQYEKWVAHMEAVYAKQFNTMRTYKHGYVKWFLRPVIESGYERTTQPRQTSEMNSMNTRRF
jgi:hypothetical protein